MKLPVIFDYLWNSSGCSIVQPQSTLSQPPCSKPPALVDDRPIPGIDGDQTGLYWLDGSPRISIPELYHRLQNLSHYPHAQAIARRHFLSTLSSSTNSLHSETSNPRSIFSLPKKYDRQIIEKWLQDEGDYTTSRFEEYVSRRRNGGSREMFKDREDAIRWCRESAVVKYVDGSWVQGTNRSTIGQGSPLRKSINKAARTSWQVMSEELGDGDLERSHVAVFEKLLEGFGEAPKGYTREFLGWLGEGMDQPNKQPWMASLLQLCVTSSPEEFFPEILGFDMAYENLALHLCISSQELRELGIDPYYFVLHISIDNGHSGHSAMAHSAALDYLDVIEKQSGPNEADKIWRRIQVAYNLADSTRTTPKSFHEKLSDPGNWNEGIIIAQEDLSLPPLPQQLTAEVLKLFIKKADTTRGLHAASRAKIGKETIGHWLDPQVIRKDGDHFMRVLAGSKAWITPGNAEESRLYKATCWGGKMFGAFTERESVLLREWVNALPVDVDLKVLELPQERDLLADITARYTEFIGSSFPAANVQPLDLSIHTTCASWDEWSKSSSLVMQSILAQPDRPRIFSSTSFPSSLVTNHPSIRSSSQAISFLKTQTLPSIPIGYLHLLISLSTAPLEWAISSSPTKLNTKLGMSIVKSLRVMYGFSEHSEGDTKAVGCLGMDDVLNAQDGVRELFPLDPSTSGGDSCLAAIILLLNTSPHRFLPILLGISLALNEVLFTLPTVVDSLSEAQRSRLEVIAEMNQYWLSRAIDLGFEASQVLWEGDNWGEEVGKGIVLGLEGILRAAL